MPDLAEERRRFAPAAIRVPILEVPAVDRQLRRAAALDGGDGMSVILTKRIAAVVERRDFCKSRVASARAVVAPSVNVSMSVSSFRRIRKFPTGNS